MSKILSYTSANVFPIKVIRHKLIPDRKGKIAPIHIQLNPTNLCNLKCEFCSCANRDKHLEIDFEKLKKIMIEAAIIGCEAVTITGGGEPLIYPKINKLIEFLKVKLAIHVGLVTNGVCLNILTSDSLKYITWIRISSSDERIFNQSLRTRYADVVAAGNNVDWSFSYVITQQPDFENIARIIDFANGHRFTHVRLVSDLLDLQNVPNMDPIRAYLSRIGVSDHLVIYQGRKEFVRGRKKCLISLLKPVIGTDGKLYGCCGSQYSQENPVLDYESSTCMGDASELSTIYGEQRHFDGSQCVRCYYDSYNIILEQMTDDIEHEQFV